ncbi:MAG: CRISPR-associated endonuclease Cas2 [Clostridiales bacterium]|nr:CRISPR-associated endonuclease Cas2 [Clostridiales bacterium]
MLVLITYDVNTTTSAGRRRLRMVAKKCVAHGTRVQNSVFECVLDNSQYKLLKHELEQLIDTNFDSLRFYTLGNNYQNKVTHIGAKETFEIEGDLIL